MKISDKIALLLISLEVLFLIVIVKDLKDRIKDLEQRNLEAHEYILNRIGG